MGASQQQFSRTPVAVASATVMNLRAPAASATASAAAPAAPAAPAADDAEGADLTEFLKPRLAKSGKHAYEQPTAHKLLIGARMRAVREAAGVTLTEAATAMGYSQPVQLSNMEHGQRLATLRVLMQYAASFGSTLDYLVGIASDPESDPATAIQRRLAAEVGEELRQLLARIAAVSVDLAREMKPVVARSLRLAGSVMEVRRALASVRNLNPGFDEDARGGAGLVSKLESAAELAIDLQERTTRLQAKARHGLVGSALTPACLDEGVSLADVHALLASGEPVSPSAVAARAAAVMGDDAEGEPDDAS
jgi:transcriptional regulator with XRE-family HTH domain